MACASSLALLRRIVDGHLIVSRADRRLTSRTIATDMLEFFSSSLVNALFEFRKAVIAWVAETVAARGASWMMAIFAEEVAR